MERTDNLLANYRKFTPPTTNHAIVLHRFFKSGRLSGVSGFVLTNYSINQNLKFQKENPYETPDLR